MTEDKLILDACCGSRMFWFDKKNPLAVFADIRKVDETLCDGRALKISPDVLSDCTEMIFDDNVFSLVVFDPPHLKRAGEKSWIGKKYGKLPENYKEFFTKSFAECFRVLKPNGVLIFKWNEDQIKTSEILSLTPYKPLFGHTTGRQAKTIWLCFMKNPTMACSASLKNIFGNG